MIIRSYENKDEMGWVHCRLLSFLDCSYFDDIRTNKETYEHPAVCLVAADGAQIVGLIDVEYEEQAGDVCYLPGALGATIWHLGVLPAYRGQGVATKLWNAAKQSLREKGIRHFEVWTQDDDASNAWYQRQGFQLQAQETYLNAFLRGTPSDDIIKKYMNCENLIHGVRCFNFEAPMECKDELSQCCYRLHEVRLYTQNCP